MKTPVAFRLTDEACAALERLAVKRGISRTAVIETLIREAAEQTDMIGLASIAPGVYVSTGVSPSQKDKRK